uniref:Virion protein n=1 Tax=Wood mouse herpesvirus TaxID=432370 RepID=D0PPB3_9GAMA|nr:virion protein [Wood mouse herpesvirus]
MTIFLPVFCDLPEVCQDCEYDESSQLSILFWISSNTYEVVENVQQFNILGKDLTFCLCRALRRLLLGVRLYPTCNSESNKYVVTGERYVGNGLVISPMGRYIQRIDTCTYVPVIYSFEQTDAHYDGMGPGKLRALYHEQLFFKGIDYSYVFSTLIRFLSMKQIDECYYSFIQTLEPWAKTACKKNYLKLTECFKNVTLTKLPVVDATFHLEYIKFNIKCFQDQWNDCPDLWPLRKTISTNLSKKHQLATIGRLMSVCEIQLRNPLAYQDHLTMMKTFPHVTISVQKKPSSCLNQKLEIVMSNTESMWLVYTPASAMFRIMLCAAYISEIYYNNTVQQAIYDVTHDKPSHGEMLMNLYRRIDYLPKDTAETITRVCSTPCENPLSDRPTTMYHEYCPIKNLSINSFKVTIFNTNMVINTKISCKKITPRFRSFLDIPRLTNNFVVKKYSVKEPSFTISVFYSDDLCKSGAININISGTLIHFLFAMGCLKCFMPIKTINPVLISNWNSTFDLQGLENQEIVRTGRHDVFWTTNFPSAVSTKRGYNISWFKAATATVSKIHGGALIDQVRGEISQILLSSDAIINTNKNCIYTTLEKRNRFQIQTLHKRFLECLFESCVTSNLNYNTVKRLCSSGIFDFSRHIISHSKNKHECALYGYRKCNLVPKILTGTKKTRLDELGRNSNYLSFIRSPLHHKKDASDFKKRLCSNRRRSNPGQSD